MDQRDTANNSSKTSTDSSEKDLCINPEPSTSAVADIIEANYEELALARSKEKLVIETGRTLYATIPKRCIVPIPLEMIETEYDKNECSYSIKKKKVITEYYISSKGMAKYFVHAEFPMRIAPVLKFTSEELMNAEKMLATIYLQSNRSGFPVNYEVTTVLDIQWPQFCTGQWYDRRPKKIKDKTNYIVYEWPSEMQKDLIRKYKCVVIPRGFLQKYGKNKDRSLEWEIAYPRVEKYLQTTMNLAQIKTYFLLMLLHKSFIEPVTKHEGITPDHIKVLMYWEMENNFLHWPETRMGRKLRQILLHLQDSLERRRQLHYFHHHKNTFGNIPDNKLYEAQKIIHQIIHNPVPYVLSALRNIKYTDPDSFYPAFDYEGLYYQLRDGDVVAQAAPKLDRKKTVTIGRTTRERRRVTVPVKPKELVDIIDFKWKCKLGPQETIRRSNILIIFIKHFIEIGKQSSNRLITKQALLYLQHAMNLTMILEKENPLQKGEVNNFIRTIETEQSRVRHATPDFPFDSMESPALPLRVSAQGFRV